MADEKRVMAFVGSPRIKGNTDLLVDEVLRGAQDAGATFEKTYLCDRLIGPCRACDACLDSGRCFQYDDMDKLLARMGQSDVWILGTPIYWWGVTAQFKTFLDRWYAPWHGEETKKVFEGRKVVLVITMGDSDPATADPVLGMFERSLRFVGVELAATVLAPGVHHLGDIAQHPELMKAAWQAGHDAVSG